MSTNRRFVGIATITRTVKGKTHTGVSLQHTYGAGGKVRYPILGDVSDLPDGLSFVRERLVGEPLPDNEDNADPAVEWGEDPIVQVPIVVQPHDQRTADVRDNRVATPGMQVVPGISSSGMLKVAFADCAIRRHPSDARLGIDG